METKRALVSSESHLRNTSICSTRKASPARNQLWARLAVGRAHECWDSRSYGFRPGWSLSTSRKSRRGSPSTKGKGVSPAETAQGPGEGRLASLGPGWAPTEAGPTPNGCAAGVGPGQLGPGDSRALTLAWRQTRVFQRLPLDHNSQGLAPAASLPDLASPPVLRAVSGPPRIARREL